MKTRRPKREKRHRLPVESYQGEIETSFTANSENRSKIFTNVAIVSGCVERLARAVSKHAGVVPLYCFMPDHVHITIRGVKPSANTWKAMCSFKQLTGFWFPQTLPRCRWQKDFYDRHVDSQNRSNVYRYILENPVKAGLCSEWAEWSFTGSIGVELDDTLRSLR